MQTSKASVTIDAIKDRFKVITLKTKPKEHQKRQPAPAVLEATALIRDNTSNQIQDQSPSAPAFPPIL